jgi:hypothetical protein
LGLFIGLMEENMWASGLMENNMEEVLLLLKQDSKEKENGIKESVSNGSINEEL